MELVSFYAVWSRRVFVSLSLCTFPHCFLRDFRPRFLISRCNCYHSLVYRAYSEDSKNLTFVLFDIFNFDTCSREVVGFFFRVSVNTFLTMGYRVLIFPRDTSIDQKFDLDGDQSGAYSPSKSKKSEKTQTKTLTTCGEQNLCSRNHRILYKRFVNNN